MKAHSSTPHDSCNGCVKCSEEKAPTEAVTPESLIVSRACLKCSDTTMIWGIGGSFFLAILKLVGGILTDSSGLIADGLQSVSCVIGSVIILFSMRVSKKEKDLHFPFGYGKIEYLVAMIVFSLLLGLGVYICGSSLLIMLKHQIEAPDIAALPVATASVIINFYIFRFSLCASSKLNSNAMEANAYQAKADLYSSLAVGAGILLAQLGSAFVIFDSLSAFLVGVLIIKDAVHHWTENMRVVLDKMPDSDYRKKIKEVLLGSDQGAQLTYTKLRRTGEKYWLGLGLCMENDGDLYSFHLSSSHIKALLTHHMPWIGHVEFFLDVKEKKTPVVPVARAE